jgi:CHAD domain
VKNGLRQLDGGGAADENIHDARKRVKQARATLRLLRKALSRAEYRREDQMLRDAAQPLGAARDAKILVEALDGLQQRYRDARHIKGIRRFRRVLLHAGNQARRHALTDAEGLPQARELLYEARLAPRTGPSGTEDGGAWPRVPCDAIGKDAMRFAT